MKPVEHQIEIGLPPRRLFDYLTTATRWPEWNPHSLQVSAEARPLMPGTRFEERARFAGREQRRSWIVRDLRPAMFWIAEAESDDGLRLQLRYDLHGRGKSCLLVLRLDCRAPGPWSRLWHLVALRRRVARESAQALGALKAALDANEKRCAT